MLITEQDNLKLTEMGQGRWHCDSGPNTYLITLTDGHYTCTCPSRKLCKHIKFVQSQHMPTIERRTDPEGTRELVAQLRSLISAIKPLKLGFGDAPKSVRWLFCNRSKGGNWYTLDKEGNPRTIPHESLTGHIRKLEFTKAIRRNKECWKLHCTIEADGLYVLETSHDSHFSKGLLSAIASLPPDALREPITIVPQASTQNAEVLFCNVWIGDAEILAPYGDQTDWKRTGRTAVDAVKLAQL
jgi:hypothetical protein